MANFRERRIAQMERSAFSPDLIPNETMWDCIRHYLQFYHSRLYREKEMRHDRLRKIKNAAFDNTMKYPVTMVEIVGGSTSMGHKREIRNLNRNDLLLNEFVPRKCEISWHKIHGEFY